MAANVELIFGFVAPIGTDIDRVSGILSEFLERVSFQVHAIRLSDYFGLEEQEKRKLSGKELYAKLMDCGDSLREIAGRQEAVAAFAVLAVNQLREQLKESKDTRRAAAIIRQFKTPDEVESLRQIYGNRLVVVSCHSSHAKRVEVLARKLADYASQLHATRFRDQAESLIMRDEEDSDAKWGQNVRKTFPLADLFVDVDDSEKLNASLWRMLEIVFRHPHRTPTRDEYGMYLAEAAALRSAALGRQVGAVITSAKGDIVSVGSNEVPRAGGGQYWEGEIPDRRDHTLGFDTNDRFKEKLLGEIMRRLIEARWIKRSARERGIESMVQRLLYDDDAILSGAQVDNIIEFGRCVHAEMAAIVDAARRGVSVDQGVLYTSTFPCHE
ncbi:MAG: hypothetical protein C0485_17265, partial [Pirellula sp.]|nr:hypothetical protein [Pirellula sp.]